MTSSDFKKKYKVKKFYSYSEEMVKATGNIKNIYFGWKESDVIDSTKTIVLSTPSKSKLVSESDAAWSEGEGVTASTIEDYRKYFSASVGASPEEFVAQYEGLVTELESYRAEKNPAYKEGEGAFMLDLAKMIVSEDGKISRFGRVYKVISP